MPLPIKKINQGEKDFPPLLGEIPGCPEQIFYMGKLPAAGEIMIAIVGTRKATGEGFRLAKEIGRDLARTGIVVVSGLAFGVDSAAHEGAILGNGKTVAVLPNGLDPIQPRSHYGLAQQILNQNGCIISEFSESRPFYKAQYLERNRLISGLCPAMVVVEAPIRSGSLSTARHALEQGREVFVVPGPAGHPNYEGSHMLLRNGARLVTSAEEILEDLKETISNLEPLISKSAPAETIKINDEIQLAIFKAIQEAREPLHVDNIVGTTKLEPNVVNQNLTFLMLEGLIGERNGKFRLK